MWRVNPEGELREESGEETQPRDYDDTHPLALQGSLSDHCDGHLKIVLENVGYWEKYNYSFQKTDRHGQLVEAKWIKNPTASKMNSDFLHPGLYRHMQRVDSIEQFAESRANLPTNWRQSVERLAQVDEVRTAYREFVHSGSLEDDMTSRLLDLVIALAVELKIHISNDNQIPNYIGGLLMLPNYAFLTRTDINIRHRLGRGRTSSVLIATELKTDSSFTDAESFYYKSRGVQLYGALYAYRAPTLLLTPTKWKLFYLDDARKRIYTYPCDEVNTDSEFDALISTLAMRHLNPEDAALTHERYLEFVSVLTICVLSRVSDAVIPLPPATPPKVTVEKTPIPMTILSEKAKGKVPERPVVEPSNKPKRKEGIKVGEFLASTDPVEYRDVWMVEGDLSEGEEMEEVEEIPRPA